MDNEEKKMDYFFCTRQFGSCRRGAGRRAMTQSHVAVPWEIGLGKATLAWFGVTLIRKEAGTGRTLHQSFLVCFVGYCMYKRGRELLLSCMSYYDLHRIRFAACRLRGSMAVRRWAWAPGGHLFGPRRGVDEKENWASWLRMGLHKGEPD